MGHVLAAAPNPERFHLVDRWLRELVQRGHRTEVLCVDAIDFAFWSAQGHAATQVAPGPANAAASARVPLRELAALDCRRLGRVEGGRAVQACERRLARLVPALVARFEHDPPDLVLLHGRRDGAQSLIQFVAREFGVRVLWTGDGLLPGTMQLDEQGLDGDARASHRTAWDFRSLPVDEELLRASLAGCLGRNLPPGLVHRPVVPPPLSQRIQAAFQGRAEGTAPGFFAGLSHWRRATTQPPHPARTIDLPTRPFVTVLLQSAKDERMRLDASRTPQPIELVRAAKAAAVAVFGSTTEIVAVLPRGGLDERDLEPLRREPGIALELSHATAEACAAAAAVVTVNSPHAAIALLAGTPVLHLGRALYGIPGVATSCRMEDLMQALPTALTEDQPELRKRCLSWLFRHGHVWCDPDEPDYNGLCGLVVHVERRLDRGPQLGASLDYRTGPAWPLAAEGRSGGS